MNKTIFNSLVLLCLNVLCFSLAQEAATNILLPQTIFAIPTQTVTNDTNFIQMNDAGTTGVVIATPQTVIDDTLATTTPSATMVTTTPDSSVIAIIFKDFSGFKKSGFNINKT